MEHEQYQLWALAALLIAGVGLWLFRRHKERKLANAEHSAQMNLFRELEKRIGHRSLKFSLELKEDCLVALPFGNDYNWSAKVTVESIGWEVTAYVLRTVGGACGEAFRFELDNQRRYDELYDKLVELFDQQIR